MSVSAPEAAEAVSTYRSDNSEAAWFEVDGGGFYASVIQCEEPHILSLRL